MTLPSDYPHNRRGPHSAIVMLLLAIATAGNSGCSLFVMAGKAIMGDPKVTAPFTAATGRDLTESKDSVVVICSVPHRIISRFPSLQVDVVDRVSRNMEVKNIKVVESGDVASWYDDHGEWGDFSELAQEFKAKYVMHIDIRTFEHRVPESENLLQGKAEGLISVYEASSNKTTTSDIAAPALMAFDRDFSLVFPSSYPVPRETRSEDLFIQSFMDRLALHVSQHMYDYNMSESIH